MRTLGTALAACIFCAACADSGRLDPSLHGPGFAHAAGGTALAPAAAAGLLAPGSSRAAEVSAALGPALVIHFDSGYQVWVYRWPGTERTTRAATELVLLLDPSGLLTKMRLRPGIAEP